MIVLKVLTGFIAGTIVGLCAPFVAGIWIVSDCKKYNEWFWQVINRY